MKIEKMNINHIPAYRYNNIKKDDVNFKSLEDVLDSENALFQNTKNKLIKGFSDGYNSVATIITTNEVEYNRDIFYQPKLRIKDCSKIQIREKGYHRFVDITLQAVPNEHNQINITTLDLEITKVRGSKGEFQELKNISYVMSKVRGEEIILNVIFDISNELEIEPFNLIIHKLVCHPVDTKPIFIYDAVIRIFSQILDVEYSKIRQKIEEKLSSYEYLFSEMNSHKIDFLKSNGKEEHDGMRLVWYNKELNPNAILHKSIDSNSLLAKEIEKLFRNTRESNIASPCPPIYRDAIIYRNEENRIIGYFNICFECSKIESHNRTQMPITMDLLNNLKKILDPVANKS